MSTKVEEHVSEEQILQEAAVDKEVEKKSEPQKEGKKPEATGTKEETQPIEEISLRRYQEQKKLMKRLASDMEVNQKTPISNPTFQRQHSQGQVNRTATPALELSQGSSPGFSSHTPKFSTYKRRTITKEGWIHKQSTMAPNHDCNLHQAWCVLNEEALTLYKAPTLENCLEQFKLENVLRIDKQPADLPNGFVIQFANAPGALRLDCGFAKEKTSWLETIEQALFQIAASLRSKSPGRLGIGIRGLKPPSLPQTGVLASPRGPNPSTSPTPSPFGSPTANERSSETSSHNESSSPPISLNSSGDNLPRSASREQRTERSPTKKSTLVKLPSLSSLLYKTTTDVKHRERGDNKGSSHTEKKKPSLVSLPTAPTMPIPTTSYPKESPRVPPTGTREKQGYLWKVGGKNKVDDNWQRRWWILNGSTLSYHRSNTSAAIAIIKLHAIQSIALNTSNTRPYSFSLVCPGRTFFLHAASEEDRDSWISSLMHNQKLAISQANAQPQPQQPSSSLSLKPAAPPPTTAQSSSADAPPPVSPRGPLSRSPSVSELPIPEDDSDEEFEVRDNFQEHYSLGRILGRGGFSTVYEGKKKATGESFAIKVIQKKNVTNLQFLIREIQIMSTIDHPYILKFYEVFEEKESFYLVLELITGKELFERITERGYYDEEDARKLISQLIEAVAYLHSKNIAHRDLKPENILTSTVGKEEIIKIIDFGLSKTYNGRQRLETVLGSPSYIAPELLSLEEGQIYSNQVDMWNVGIIAYFLLCGAPPFRGSDQSQIFHKILSADFCFDDDIWECVDESGKDLIKHLLVVDPSKRFTAEDCKNHPWIKNAIKKKHKLSISGALKRNTHSWAKMLSNDDDHDDI